LVTFIKILKKKSSPQLNYKLCNLKRGQIFPLNWALALFFEEVIALGEMMIAKETSVCRKWRWMHRGQDVVLLLQGKY
jgi:hypothetical protein